MTFTFMINIQNVIQQAMTGEPVLKDRVQVS